MKPVCLGMTQAGKMHASKRNKRREMYTEMQMLMSDDGGTVIPMYANYVDAHSTKLANSGTIGNVFQMDSSRLMERWWFA